MFEDREAKKRICYIFGAGDYQNITLSKEALQNSFVIAADGGCLFLQKQKIRPDLILGDFDSFSFGELVDKEKEEIEILRFPPEKNDTDMMLSVKEGIKRGFDTFYLYGAMGGRFDHTIANIQILAYLAAKGCKAFLVGEREVLTAICNGKIQIEPAKWQGKYISVFCHGKEAKGVCLKGLKYPLEQAILTPQIPLGVSNELIGECAEISVKEGILLIIMERKSS